MSTPSFTSARRHGFTLVELMIVVVVIGILAAIAVPKFTAVSRKSREAEAAPILKQLHTLQERHRHAQGSFATSMEELEGGSGNFTEGKYYRFELGAADGRGYVACASPLNEVHGLRSFQIDQTGGITAGEC